MMVECDTQQEIDHFWESLSQGGQTQSCGWLSDRHGLSWQIVPSTLANLMTGDAATSGRVMQALWGMVKPDIAGLLKAAESVQ